MFTIYSTHYRWLAVHIQTFSQTALRFQVQFGKKYKEWAWAAWMNHELWRTFSVPWLHRSPALPALLSQPCSALASCWQRCLPVSGAALRAQARSGCPQHSPACPCSAPISTELIGFFHLEKESIEAKGKLAAFSSLNLPKIPFCSQVSLQETAREHRQSPLTCLGGIPFLKITELFLFRIFMFLWASGNYKISHEICVIYNSGHGDFL